MTVLPVDTQLAGVVASARWVSGMTLATAGVWEAIAEVRSPLSLVTPVSKVQLAISNAHCKVAHHGHF